jgi:pimeloyl-ACP methyl ester carboxylesterase
MAVRRVTTNGIELELRDEGEGPLVVLCHGFPELAYSWRHQIPALSGAGYRVLAPDMRGFGGSSIPTEVEAYDVATLCGDLSGLLDSVGADAAVFVGHDWGANVVWQMAIQHPQRVRAVAGLSVPFIPRAPAPPVPIMRAHFGEDFYIVWFQEPGVADEALAGDVRRTLTTSRVWTAQWAEEEPDGSAPKRPRWITEEELAVYVEAFELTGFTGGLNWYRNIDRNWELSAPFAERRIEQPAMFLTGERDGVRSFMPAEAMRGWVTDLRYQTVVRGAGHWVQQEAPEIVNAALLAFIARRRQGRAARAARRSGERCARAVGALGTTYGAADDSVRATAPNASTSGFWLSERHTSESTPGSASTTGIATSFGSSCAISCASENRIVVIPWPDVMIPSSCRPVIA